MIYKKINNLNSFVLLFLLSFFSCSEKQESKPNILFIMSDDHTSQAWGIYGGVLADYIEMPNISRLAEQGCVLNNSFCTNSICVPSRASIMTGKYSHINGVTTLGGNLSPDSLNVAKVLQQNGYQTALFGKWHLKKEPAGFDKYMVLPGQGQYHNPVFKTLDNWKDGRAGGKEYKGFSSDLIANYSIDWIKSRDTEKPFFLMCHFKATHEPFDYPERKKDMYSNIELPYPESVLDFSPHENGRTFIGQKLEILGKRWEESSKDSKNGFFRYPGLPFTTDGLDSIEARKKIYQKFVKDFLRCGSAIDDNIGKLLDYLEESGLAKNTVVIYTADQGYFLGEHGFFDKRMIYEESLRMPFVIAYPKEIEGGSRIDDIILNIDFPSLFLDYAEIKQPASFQGRSFRENLRGNTPKDWRESMYYRYWMNDPNRPAHLGIRTERYKLALMYGQPENSSERVKMPVEPGWEFYDLTKDKQEMNNQYNNLAYKEIIETLKAEMLGLKAAYGDTDEGLPMIRSIIENEWNN